MSDDYFFDDEAFNNSALIAGLDAFEVTHNLQQQQTTYPAPAPAPLAPRPAFRPPSRLAPAPAPNTTRPKSPLTEVINISDDDEYKFDDSFDLKDTNWDEFDQQVEVVQIQQPQETTAPVPGPSNTRQFSRTSSGKLQQQRLWGLPAPPDNRHKLPPRQKGKTIKKTKTWDRTEYAKSGWRASKKKNQDEAEPHEEEPVEFEQFPQPTNLGETHLRLTFVTD